MGDVVEATDPTAATSEQPQPGGSTLARQGGLARNLAAHPGRAGDGGGAVVPGAGDGAVAVPGFRRQAERWQRQGSYPYGQSQPTYQEPAPQYEEPPPQPQQDLVQQLKDLADLKDQSRLIEEEFAAQKARILGQLNRPLTATAD